MAQGYGHLFNVSEKCPKNKNDPYNASGSQPSKPRKPQILDTYSAIKQVLDAPADAIIHPAFIKRENLPPKMFDAIQSMKANYKNRSFDEEDQRFIRHVAKVYFTKHARAVVERQAITMSLSDEGDRIYQIDVTREWVALVPEPGFG